jgi:hypothetical protein
MGRSPRVIGRASLALIALLDLGAVLLAIHAASPVSVAAALAGPVFVVVPLVGAYVAARRPENPVPWIFLAAGVALALFAFSGSYAYEAFNAGSLPAGPAFAWVAGLASVYVVPLVAGPGVLLFPDGRLPGRRWRPVAWLAALMLAALTFGRAFSPQLDHWSRANPLALPGGLAPVADGIQAIGLLLIFPVSALAAVSLVRRVRGADSELAPVIRLANATAILVALSYLACLIWSLGGGATIDVAALEGVPVVGLGS